MSRSLHTAMIAPTANYGSLLMPIIFINKLPNYRINQRIIFLERTTNNKAQGRFPTITYNKYNHYQKFNVKNCYHQKSIHIKNNLRR